MSMQHGVCHVHRWKQDGATLGSLRHPDPKSKRGEECRDLVGGGWGLHEISAGVTTRRRNLDPYDITGTQNSWPIQEVGTA